MGLHKNCKPNNPTGRPAGSQNKVTVEIRQRINDIVENQLQTFESDLQAIEPKDRLQMIEKLLSYLIPKMQAQSIEIDINKLTDEQLQRIIENIKIE
jgi:hypothetical protein